MPAAVEIAQVDVAHRSFALQRLQLLPAHDASIPDEDGVLAGGPDSDKGDVGGAGGFHDARHGRVAQEGLARLPASRHAGRGQEHGLASEEMGEPAGELGGMHVPAGVDDGAQSLDDDALAHVAVRVSCQRVHHGEDRSPPAHHDPVLRPQDPQQVFGGPDAHLAGDGRLLLVVGGLHDHRLPQPEAFLHLPLQVIVYRPSAAPPRCARCPFPARRRGAAGSSAGRGADAGRLRPASAPTRGKGGPLSPAACPGRGPSPWRERRGGVRSGQMPNVVHMPTVSWRYRAVKKISRTVQKAGPGGPGQPPGPPASTSSWWAMNTSWPAASCSRRAGQASGRDPREPARAAREGLPRRSRGCRRGRTLIGGIASPCADARSSRRSLP